MCVCEVCELCGYMYELCVRVCVRVYVCELCVSCVRVRVHTVRLPHAVHTAVLPGGHTHKPPSPSWPLGRCAGCAQRPSRARPAGPRGAGGGPSHGKGSLSPRRKPGLSTGHVRTKGLCEAQHSVCFWVTRRPSFSIWERDAFTATMVSITSGTAAYTGPARARPLHGPVPRRTARLGTRPPTETRAASPGLPGSPGRLLRARPSVSGMAALGHEHPLISRLIFFSSNMVTLTLCYHSRGGHRLTGRCGPSPVLRPPG